MKKVLGVVFVLTFAVLATSNSQLFSRSFLKPTDAIDLDTTNEPDHVLGTKSKSIKFVWFKVDDIDRLRLIPNFTEKLTAKNIKEKYNCKNLINGGFYTKDDKPIGLFISDSTKLRDFVKASLNNGFVSVNDFATPRITSSLPKDHLTIALQNGPLLFENGNKTTLKLQSDKPARRMVAATTGENELVFIAFYNPDSAFDGPYLAELPDRLEDFEKETNMQIADALNLDGGTASAFSSEKNVLSEASIIGSAFCELYLPGF